MNRRNPELQHNFRKKEQKWDGKSRNRRRQESPRQTAAGNGHGPERFFQTCSARAWRKGSNFKSTSPNRTADSWPRHWASPTPRYIYPDDSCFRFWSLISKTAANVCIHIHRWRSGFKTEGWNGGTPKSASRALSKKQAPYLARLTTTWSITTWTTRSSYHHHPSAYWTKCENAFLFVIVVVYLKEKCVTSS